MEISRRQDVEKERFWEGEITRRCEGKISHLEISWEIFKKSRVQDFFLQSPVECKTYEDNAYFEFGYPVIWYFSPFKTGTKIDKANTAWHLSFPNNYRKLDGLQALQKRKLSSQSPSFYSLEHTVDCGVKAIFGIHLF